MRLPYKQSSVLLLGIILSPSADAQVVAVSPPNIQFPTPTESVQPGFSLDEAVMFSVQNHPTLREGRAAVEQALGNAYQARLYPNPRIDSGNPQTIGGANSIYSIGVTQEIVRGGKRQLDVSAAEQAVRRAQFEYQQKRFELMTAVRRSFVAVIASQQRIENLELLLKFANELETTSNNLLKAGQTTETDLLLLRMERRRAESALQVATSELQGRKAQLAAQLGVPDMDIGEAKGELTMKVPDYLELRFDEGIVGQNASINAVRAEVSRSQDLVRRAIAEPIPNVTLQGGTQYTVSQPHEQALIGVYMDVPIWNRNQGAIRAAESNVRRTVAQLDMTRIDLARQLADALSRFRSATQRVKSYEEGMLPDAQRTLSLVRSGYDRGQFDIVRLVQAQRSVFEVNLEYLASLESRLDSAAEIAGLLQSETFP